MGNLANDNRDRSVGYEEYEDTSCTPRDGSRLGLSRLASERAVVNGTDGSASEGRWVWWTSSSCRSANIDALREQAASVRVQQGMDLPPSCPDPDVPGVTCQRKFYPETTEYPDGGVRLQHWVFSPLSDVGRAELHHQVEAWNVLFTQDEWVLYRLLSDDGFLRQLSPEVAVAIYYSVLQWKCTGEITPRLDPSPVSPQSLQGRHDTGSQYWLEYWERDLRNRLWKIRTDLRTITLPDGSKVAGLRDPKEVEVRPSCTSSTGQLIMTTFSIVTGIAGLAMSWPAWITLLWDIPLQLDQFRQQLKIGSFMRKAQEGVGAAQAGTPTGPQAPPTANEKPAPTDPTGLAERAAGVPVATPSKAGTGILLPLAIIAALALS